MSRFNSLASLARRFAAPSSTSLRTSVRSFSSFSASTPHAAPPSASAASTRRQSSMDNSEMEHFAASTASTSLNASFPNASRAMPLTELNNRGKELMGEDHVMEGDMEAAGPVMDPIDSTLSDTGSEVVFEQMRLSDILKGKQRYGTAIHSVSSSDRIVAATQMMTHLNIGAVLVRDATNPNRIAGIVSTRDYVRKIQEKSLDPTATPVSEIMTASPVFAYSDETALSCLQLMTKHNFRHLPVRERSQNGKESERTVGLVSIGDLVRVMLKQYQESNVYLREYIDGKYGQ